MRANKRLILTLSLLLWFGVGGAFELSSQSTKTAKQKREKSETVVDTQTRDTAIIKPIILEWDNQTIAVKATGRAIGMASDTEQPTTIRAIMASFKDGGYDAQQLMERIDEVYFKTMDSLDYVLFQIDVQEQFFNIGEETVVDQALAAEISKEGHKNRREMQRALNKLRVETKKRQRNFERDYINAIKIVEKNY